MKIYYDTEFTSLDGNVDWGMISAGFVTEDGRELYIEINDFQRDDCSQFVLDTVLPLLGKGDVLPERMASTHFASRFCTWLAQFDEDIALVSDSPVDWNIVHAYCYTEFAAAPVKVCGQVWQRSESPIVAQCLANTEAEFWNRPGNRDMIHHALYDARRLKLLADKQRSIMEAL